MRYDRVDASGQSYDATTRLPIDRADDPLRDKRTRLSLMLGILPGITFDKDKKVLRRARIRCQYSFDEAEILKGSGEAHTLWVTVELEPPPKGD